MNGMNIRLTTLVIVIPLVFTASLGWAHGDEHHMDPNMIIDNPIRAKETPFGRQGITMDVSRTIDISMNDHMRFSPDALMITQSETVRLRITNVGKISHEFVLGTTADIAEHAEMMRKFPETMIAAASSIRVPPGKNAEIIWQFSKPGRFLYACLVPGHWESGMQGAITVTP